MVEWCDVHDCPEEQCVSQDHTDHYNSPYLDPPDDEEEE